MGRFDKTDVGHSREPLVLCWSLERKDNLAEQRGRKGMPINWDMLEASDNPEQRFFCILLSQHSFCVLFMNATSSPCVWNINKQPQTKTSSSWLYRYSPDTIISSQFYSPGNTTPCKRATPDLLSQPTIKGVSPFDTQGPDFCLLDNGRGQPQIGAVHSCEPGHYLQQASLSAFFMLSTPSREQAQAPRYLVIKCKSQTNDAAWTWKATLRCPNPRALLQRTKVTNWNYEMTSTDST